MKQKVFRAEPPPPQKKQFFLNEENVSCSKGHKTTGKCYQACSAGHTCNAAVSFLKGSVRGNVPLTVHQYIPEPLETLEIMLTTRSSL